MIAPTTSARAAILVDEVRRRLRAIADPALAPGQQAYMKSAMPFLGVRVPEVRRETRAASTSETDTEALLDAATALWSDAGHREERYAAMAILALRPLRADPRILPVVERWTREGRWWDITDELAHRVAEAHDARPEETAALVRRWSVDDDLWVRRLAILSQLGRRDRLDPTLLAEVIAPNLADPEFFLRKAIGWALREYARVDPAWVRAYADAHPLSALSRREALRHAGTATA